MPASRDSILAQLDEHAMEFVFPMLDNGYEYPVDTRLRVYRDAARWALLIEVLGYSARRGSLADVLYVVGDGVTGSQGVRDDDFLVRIGDDVEDPDNAEHARPGLKSVRIRDRDVALAAHSDPWPLPDLFRSLVPAHRDLLLATEGEIRERVPVDLPQLVRLEQWHHPDLSNGQMPSECETFQQIAEAIVTGDAAKIRPTLAPNTHWKNWPEGGML
jgi:hypothetical protein